MYQTKSDFPIIFKIPSKSLVQTISDVLTMPDVPSASRIVIAETGKGTLLDCSRHKSIIYLV